MTTLENYKKANLNTLIPTTIRLKNKSTKIVMIPKNELWYESTWVNTQRSSGFMLDKLQIALDKRGINYVSAFYSFI